MPPSAELDPIYLETLGQLRQELIMVVHRIDVVLKTTQEDAITIAKVQTKVEALSERVEEIHHTLKSGNGSQPLTTRVALAEQSLKQFDEWREMTAASSAKYGDRLAALELARVTAQDTTEAARERENANRTGRWQVWATVIAGLFSLVAVAISLLK